MYISSTSKKSIEFDKIREGTIFTCGGLTYLRGNNNAAVNMKTGEIIYPVNDPSGGWDKCYIYPQASLILNRRENEAEV